MTVADACRWQSAFRDIATLTLHYPTRCLHAHRQRRSTPALCSKPEHARLFCYCWSATISCVRSWRSATASRLHGGELSLSRQASSHAAQVDTRAVQKTRLECQPSASSGSGVPPPCELPLTTGLAECESRSHHDPPRVSAHATCSWLEPSRSSQTVLPMIWVNASLVNWYRNSGQQSFCTVCNNATIRNFAPLSTYHMMRMTSSRPLQHSSRGSCRETHEY